MKDTLNKIGDIFISIMAWILIILLIYFSFRFVIFLGKSVYKFITEPEPICYYHYIDANGYEGTANICRSYMGNIYCGNKEDVHLITFVERVCENK